MLAPLALAALLAAATPVERAEALADEATALAASDPAAAQAKALEALELTGSFVPTAFVDAGRKGEVVEDEFVAAREAYRRHRARLYRALGEAQLAAGRTDAAARHLRRAQLLHPGGGAALPLARALVSLERGEEALVVLGLERSGGLSGEAERLAQAAADAARVPSLQVEIDLLRLAAIESRSKLEARRGRFELAPRTRSSTGGYVSLDVEEPTLFYVADTGCRSCSADLEAIARLDGPGLRVMMAPEDPENDRALRQALQVYRYSWPFLVRSSFIREQQLEAPAVLVVARRGWLGVVVEPPLLDGLPAVLEALRHTDVRESLPRPRWDQRPPRPLQTTPQPGLLPEGLAPAEEAAPPAEFEQALAAFRAGEPARALQLFDAVAARHDGWLLPPEAELNRALCLAAQGRREQARKALLAIGDSRFQDHVDRELERVGSGG